MSEEKSTRRKRFEKVATNRVNTILKTLDNLEKCSNKNNYEFNDNDVRKMEKAIREKFTDVMKSFNSELNKGSKTEFKF